MNPVKSIWSWRWSKECGWHQFCFYCERPMVAPLVRTYDHIVPKSKGGKLAKDVNCVLSCSECNHLKAAHDIYQFRELLISRLPNDRTETMIKNINVLIELIEPIYPKLTRKKYAC